MKLTDEQKFMLRSVINHGSNFLLTLLEDKEQPEDGEGEGEGEGGSGDDSTPEPEPTPQPEEKKPEKKKRERRHKEEPPKEEKPAEPEKKPEPPPVEPESDIEEPEDLKPEPVAPLDTEGGPAKEEVPAPKEDIKKTNPDELLATARAAAIAYAGKHGREGLRALLNEFTKGTIAEVPADKLPALVKKLLKE